MLCDNKHLGSECSTLILLWRIEKGDDEDDEDYEEDEEGEEKEEGAVGEDDDEDDKSYPVI